MKKITPILALFLLLFSTAAFAAEWMGQITKKDGKLWFSSGGNVYSITNPDKASAFENQTVKVMGTADKAAKSVTISTIQKGQ